MEVYFEWGETESCDKATPSKMMEATGEFSYRLTGLQPDHLYYFRAVTAGGQKGKNSVFKTLGGGIVPLPPGPGAM
jgi:hypothetical protein